MNRSDRRKDARLQRRRHQEQNRQNPQVEQFLQLAQLPIELTWSDGSKSQSCMAWAFDDDDTYKRYAQYKAEGKLYPVSAAAIITGDQDLPSKIFPGSTVADEMKLLQGMCEGFSDSLRRYLEIEDATHHIMKQAEEATAAMQANLPDLEGAEL